VVHGSRIKPQGNHFRAAQISALGLVRLQQLRKLRVISSLAPPGSELPLFHVNASLPDNVPELTLGDAHQRGVVGRREISGRARVDHMLGVQAAQGGRVHAANRYILSTTEAASVVLKMYRLAAWTQDVPVGCMRLIGGGERVGGRGKQAYVTRIQAD
jgi:hypothetical protein